MAGREDVVEIQVTDDDLGEITATVNGKEVRGWVYKTDDDRRAKMLLAREYVEGWTDGWDARDAP